MSEPGKKSGVGSPKSERKVKQTTSADNPATSELPTENLKLPTEPMEVHHHPQLEHKPKPWKEYLLEYFMIFLAVTTGFFAESYREHLSERSKEKEYVISIRKDLVTDIANMDVWLPALYNRVAKFDTLITCLESPGTVKNGARMYYLARMATRNSIFQFNDNTILEMKSSGNLRLIRNRDILNGLMDFERAIGQYQNLLDIESKENVLSYPLLGELFDAAIFDKMVTINLATEKQYIAGATTLSMPPGNPQLRSHDKDKINQLTYFLHQRKASFMGEIHILAIQQEMIKKLIKQLNEEYNLDHE